MIHASKNGQQVAEEVIDIRRVAIQAADNKTVGWNIRVPACFKSLSILKVYNWKRSTQSFGTSTCVLHKITDLYLQSSIPRGQQWTQQDSFHAQVSNCHSSTWFDLAPDFRQEICQSHYRNDPVKYDLAFTQTLFRLYRPMSTIWVTKTGSMAQVIQN